MVFFKGRPLGPWTVPRLILTVPRVNLIVVTQSILFCFLVNMKNRRVNRRDFVMSRVSTRVVLVITFLLLAVFRSQG